MNILYISTKDPRLTNGGNEQRTNHLWEALKRIGHVYTILPDNSLEGQDELVDGMSPIYKFKPQVKGKFSIGRIINSLICRLSILNMWGYLTLKDRTMPNPFPNVKFDIVVTRYIFSSCLWNFTKIAPTYIDVDDFPIQVYTTTCRPRMPFFLRPFTDWLIRYQTNKILKRSAGGWIANKEQLVYLGDNYGYLPNIPLLPTNKYHENERSRNYLFTIGNMAYRPNYMGVDKFLSEVWPSFHTIYPEVKYVIAGNKAPKEYADRWNNTEGVDYKGFVENIEETYSHCIASVVPIYTGGGTCIKTLESLAYSRVCLATPFGARGLDLNIANDNGLLVFCSAPEFIDCYKNCLVEERRKQFEMNAKCFIQNNLSLDTFYKSVDSIIKL